MSHSSSFKRARCAAYAGLTLLCTFDARAAAPPRNAAASVHDVSVYGCSRHPELFKVRPLTAGEAWRLIKPAPDVPTVRTFKSARLIYGECTKFVRTFANGIILTNGARFGVKDFALVPAPPADPKSGPQPNHFSPPKNVMAIDSDKFVEGNGRHYVAGGGFGSDYIALWTGAKGSAIGTIDCDSQLAGSPCRLGHLILSSRYSIREFDFLPAPHPEMTGGGLWLSINLGPTEEALASFTIEYGHLYGS